MNRSKESPLAETRGEVEGKIVRSDSHATMLDLMVELSNSSLYVNVTLFKNKSSHTAYFFKILFS